MTTTDTTTSLHEPHDVDFGHAVEAMRHHVAELVHGTSSTTLFSTDAGPDGALFGAFLAGLPEHERAHHRCRACERFIEHYGRLVAIDEDGSTRSLWPELSRANLYHRAFAALDALVARARVNGVFVSTDALWGTPSNYGSKAGHDWHHLHLRPPAAIVAKPDRLKTPGQRMAELDEEYRMLRRSLAEFGREPCRTALHQLESGQLFRSEKCLGVARWLVGLHAALAATQNTRTKDAICWRAVAEAPAGFCHVRSGMIGTLLTDITLGKPFAEIARAFAEKMNPLQYQRPQAAPSVGNIAAAEAIVEKLGIRRSLERRYARLEDVTAALWRPSTPNPESARAQTGVFDHLKPVARMSKDSGVPPVTMTWRKFAETILPNARQIEMHVQSHGNFCALVTAVHPDAPPILQWDRDDDRNPVSMYLYSGGSRATQWRLSTADYVTVAAITADPSTWRGVSLPNRAERVLFLLEGARDTRNDSLALFPETLRSELHPIRATIERYSKMGKLADAELANACGYVFGGTADKPENPVTLRVTAGDFRTLYIIDRMD